jgi:hypothetical protein
MFVCKPCKVEFNTKFSYNRHCDCIKHKNNVKKAANKINQEMMCMNCKRKYKHSSSFYRHRKNCNVIPSECDYKLEIEKLKYDHEQIILQIKELHKSESEIETKKIKTIQRKAKIPAAVRKIVWNTYIGKDKNVGKCLCCDAEDISNINFECGHIKSEKNGGEVNIENLRPICGHCNKSIGSKNMDEFMTLYKIKKPNNWDGIVKSEN